MRRILVFGGTRYFGKRLVQLLLDAGDEVTLASRMMTPDPFGDRVKRIQLDRTNRESMQKGLQGKTWDLVYDQICYSPNDALIACEILKDKTKRYILTSTQSVYLEDGIWQETDFNPFTEAYKLGSARDFPYGQAKRYAESVFFQTATFPVAAMRIPIVLGEDDYKGRLEFHIRKTIKGEPQVIPNENAETGFIHSSDAAKFLFWLGRETTTNGPLNAASPETISIGNLLKKIGLAVGRASLVYSEGDPKDETALVDRESSYLKVTKAQNLGYEFMPLESWLPGLIEHYIHLETRI